MAAEDGALSRRDLLRGRFLGSLVGLAERQVAKRLDSVRGAAVPPRGSGPLPPVHRPPGALPESQFLQQCTRCGDCIDACPHSAVILAPARFGPAAGSPMIDASGSPCWMCDGTPCITACEPGALTHDAEALKMGTARIQELDCLAHQGTTCTVCSERCPVPGAMSVEAGRPWIVADACTGCGVCHHVCPAPRNAVLVLPGSPA